MLKNYLAKGIKILDSSRFIYAILAIFALQVVYLILSLRIGLPPDELFHIRFIEYYAEHSWDPFIYDQNSSFALEDISREVGYFYHYLMSLVYRLLPMPDLAKYLMLRGLVLLVSIATLWLVAKTARLMKISWLHINLALLFMTNLASWQLMSSAINNDSLVWLGTALGVYFLARMYVKKFEPKYWWLLVITVLLTSLVKKTFLPIGLVFAGAGLYLLVKNWTTLKQSVFKPNRLMIGLLILSVLSLGLFAERVGYNLIRFGQIDVHCTKIHETDECLQNGVIRRNFHLLEIEAKPSVELGEFVPYWFWMNNNRLLGPQAWVGEDSPSGWYAAGSVLFAYTGLLGLVIYYTRNINREKSALWFVVLLGLGFVVANLVVNFQIYQKYAVQGLALQGRYVLPVYPYLILGFVLGNYALFKQRFSKSTVIGLLVILVMLTIFQSGLSRILNTEKFVKNPARPIMIYDRPNAIGPREPSVD